MEIDSYYTDDSTDSSIQSAYSISAICIFVVMSITFLFPCNPLIPLDRRTVAVLCAVLCYVTRSYAFRGKSMNIVEAVDFDVLGLVKMCLRNHVHISDLCVVLLASIMAINYLIVNLKETKKIVRYLQNIIKVNPEKGYWMVSAAAFIVSPFLTNDGVCLLFVVPILDAFDDVFEDKSLQNSSPIESIEGSRTKETNKLHKEDAVYFMLVLACSANIGSALTYTGNPQNMIISEDSISVLPSWLFTSYLLLPTIFSWLLTSYWIQHCWKSNKDKIDQKLLTESTEPQNLSLSNDFSEKSTTSQYAKSEEAFCLKFTNSLSLPNSPINSPKSCGSPRRRKAPKKNGTNKEMFENVAYVLSSPIPYLIVLLFLAMIILIFVDVMPIAGLICVSSIIMIVSVVVGNHWRGKSILIADSLHKSKIEDDRGDKILEEDNLLPLQPMLTEEEKLENLNEFFENLFNSLDYSLLFIFLGTFIVVANLESTGIPKIVWAKIVGKVPFHTFSSVIGITLFVLIASQFLGNVAIIQLTKPNIEILSEQERKFAWAIISYIATVGGNLTITGSAANIIVCEKAAKIHPDSTIHFFRHLAICFIVTLISCGLGGLIIALLMKL